MSIIRTRVVTGLLVCAPLIAFCGERAAEPETAIGAAGPTQLAQASPTEEEKQKRELEHKREQGKGAPPAQKEQPQPPPKAAVPVIPPKAAAPVIPPKVAVPATLPKTVVPATPPAKAVIPVPPVSPASPAPKIVTPVPALPHAPVAPKAAVPTAPASSAGTTPAPQSPVGQPKPASDAKAGSIVVPEVKAGIEPAPHFDQVQKGRQERVEDGGRRTVIHEPGNRVIVKQDNHFIIQHDEAERFQRLRGAQTERRANGVVETYYVRSDGFRVITEVDANGRMLRRYRRGPDGQEYIIVDNRNFWRNAGIGAGVAALTVALALNLPPPRVTIPRERYIVDYERASDDELDEALSAPPVDRLEHAYALEEVRYSYELRERMRRIDLDAITFEFGAYEVTPEQYPRLERLANSINRLINRNTDEVFLIEGHTDSVGSDIDNLSLSDRRASAVAQVLTEAFGIPPENLVTQGYGKQYLKIETPGPERANRRVAIRRITPLMSQR